MKRWAKALLAGSALLLGFAGYEALRASRLAKNGADLVRVAEGFPRDYTIGAPSASMLVALGDSVALGVGADRLEHTLSYRVADAAAFPDVTSAPSHLTVLLLAERVAAMILAGEQ